MQASQHLPAVQKMLKQAEAVLGYDLLKLCLEGPKEKLDDTVYSQPALYVAGLAAVERLRQEDSVAVNDCTATAGQSSETRRHVCLCVSVSLCLCVSVSLRHCISVSYGIVYLGSTTLAATAAPQCGGCADACLLSLTLSQTCRG